MYVQQAGMQGMAVSLGGAGVLQPARFGEEFSDGRLDDTGTNGRTVAQTRCGLVVVVDAAAAAAAAQQHRFHGHIPRCGQI